MPDFEQRKRRSLTDQQLYEEYHKYGKGSSLSSARKKKKPGVKLSDDPAFKTRQTGNSFSSRKKDITDEIDFSRKTGAAKAASKSKKSGSAAAKRSSPVSGRNREQTEKSVAAAKKSKTFAGKKSTVINGRKTKPAAKKDSGKKSKKSKRRQGKYTLYYIFIGVVVIIALSILSATVLFNIGEFAVKGDTKYSDEEIIKACGIEVGENLLRVNTVRGAERIVEKLVYIDSAEIHRGFPNKLNIIVKPAVAAAAFNYGGKYYVTSEGNRLLEIADSGVGYPIIRGFSFNQENMPKEGDHLADDEEKRLSIVNTIVSGLKTNGLTKSSVIDVTDTLELKVTYDDRIEINFGNSTGLESKIYNASCAIKDKISDNERCTLYFINQYKAVARPIRDDPDDGYIVTEETTAPESTETAAEEAPAAE